MRTILCLSVFLTLFFGCKSYEKDAAAVEIEALLEVETDTTPVAFSVYDFDGLLPLLSKEDDTTYIVNFWATWCKPCVEELPFFEKTYAEQKDNNVELVLVSLDMPSMWKSRLEPFVKNKDLKGKVVILDDPKMNEWIPKVDENWEGGIPATLIYNKTKRAFYPTGFTYEELNTELKKFINTKP